MNTRKTSTFFGERLSLEAPPAQTMKIEECKIYQWSLMVRYLLAHWMVPRSSLPSKNKLCSESPATKESGDIERKTLRRRHGRLTEIHVRRRGPLHLRPLREATFMHRRPEELPCKMDRDAEFVEEGAQPVDDLRLNTRKPTLRQHKQVCLAMGGMHKTLHQRRITAFGLTLKVGLQSSRMSAKIRGRNRSLQIKVACT